MFSYVPYFTSSTYVFVTLCRIMKAKRIKPIGDSTGPSIFSGLKGFQSSSFERNSLTTTLIAPPLTIDAKKTTSPFLNHLKGLNESVTKWIKEHVNNNPYVDLTPIFADYKTHLSNIESKVSIYIIDVVIVMI